MSQQRRGVYQVASAQSVVRLRGRTVDLVRGEVEADDGTVIRLTSREQDLLRFLVDHPGQTVSRFLLLTEVWGYSDDMLSRACDNAIRRLRQKLEDDPSHPHHLLTVRGEGYRFVPTGSVPPGAPTEPPTPEPGEEHLRLGALSVDLGRQVVVDPDGGRCSLTVQEVEILRVLSAASGAVVSRRVLERKVWGRSRGRAVDHAVHRLRVKLEADPAEPRFLHTLRGAGFRLEVHHASAVHDTGATFVGRQPEATALTAALQPGAWVLVVGSGGIGKTRLTRRVVAQLQGTSIWWVECAGVQDRSGLCRAVAEALDLVGPQAADVAISRIGATLAQEGGGVLVLDNVEGLGASLGPPLAAWRRASPSLCVVGTSRVRLGLSGEVAVELGPLSVEEGCALYADRARAASSRSVLRGSELDAARRVVQRLDGVPLAIELAAARSSVLPPSALEQRLDRVMDVLVHEGACEVRHRSLRATFELSTRLLSEPQSRALALLSLFSASFDVDDAEGLLGADAALHLQVLRDHHLVLTDWSRPLPRFRVAEALRAYLARDRAEQEDSGRADEVSLARWLARLGDGVHMDSLMTRGDVAAWEVQRHYARDLLAMALRALHWSEPELAARCAAAAILGSMHHHPSAAAVEVADQVLAEPAVSTVAALWLRANRGRLLMMLDRFDEADPAGDAQQAEGASQPLVQATLLGMASTAARRTGSGEEAPLVERAAEVFDTLDAHARASLCRGQAQLLRGEVAEGRRSLVDAERRARAAGEAMVAAHAAREIGVLDVAAGRPHDAVERFRAALATFDAIDNVPSVYAVLYYLQDLALWTGQVETFDQATEQALRACRRRGSNLDEATSHALSTGSWLARGELLRASASMEAARVALARVPATEASHAAFLGWFEAEVELARGRPEEAAHVAGAAHATLTSMGVGVAGAVACTQAAGLAATDPVGALELARAGVGALAGAPGRYLAFAWARRGLVACAAGATDEARRALSEADALAAEAGVDGALGWAGRLLGELRAFVAQ
ncbi:MAG: winged helix-turn-helix domain-containing protein [Myxococcales bacterium]|nr:winged helix-turn-helix domain-containing protein [Myxococcales bacterium]